MNVVHTAIPDLLILEPKVFGDARGFFFESWNARAFAQVTVAVFARFGEFLGMTAEFKLCLHVPRQHYQSLLLFRAQDTRLFI